MAIPTKVLLASSNTTSLTYERLSLLLRTCTFHVSYVLVVVTSLDTTLSQNFKLAPVAVDEIAQYTPSQRQKLVTSCVLRNENKLFTSFCRWTRSFTDPAWE